MSRFTGIPKEERIIFTELLLALAFKYSDEALIHGTGIHDNIVKEKLEKLNELKRVIMQNPDGSSKGAEMHDIQDISEETLLKTPKDINKELDSYVIGQAYAKKILSVAFFNHIRRINAFNIAKNMGKSKELTINKTSVIMVGPTGTGKTYMVEQLSQIFNIPMYVGDASTLSQTGFVGKNATDFVEQLYLKSHKNIEATERGIIFIDEIDKLATNKEGKQNSMAEGTQQSLLKMIEGSEVIIESQEPGDRSKTTINTKNIMFIFAGAFVGLVGDSSTDKKTIGLVNKAVIDDGIIDESIKVSHQDFIKYGMIPELIGRISMIAQMHSLSQEDLVAILKETKNNSIEQYQHMLTPDEILLSFDISTYELIAEKAMELKTGARSLKSIVDYLMIDKIYDIETQGDNKTKTINVSPVYVEEKLKDYLKGVKEVAV